MTVTLCLKQQLQLPALDAPHAEWECSPPLNSCPDFDPPVKSRRDEVWHVGAKHEFSVESCSMITALFGLLRFLYLIPLAPEYTRLAGRRLPHLLPAIIRCYFEPRSSEVPPLNQKNYSN